MPTQIGVAEASIRYFAASPLRVTPQERRASRPDPTWVTRRDAGRNRKSAYTNSPTATANSPACGATPTCDARICHALRYQQSCEGQPSETSARIVSIVQDRTIISLRAGKQSFQFSSQSLIRRRWSRENVS